MKKNWLLFIVICTGIWLWMVYDGSKRNSEYEAKVAAHQAATEARRTWELDEEERKRQERAEAARKLAELQEAALNGTTTNGDTATQPEVGALPVENGDPTTTAAIRTLQARLYNPTTAPLHIVETDLYKIVFSEMGAVPISWEIKSSEFVTNLADPDSRKSDETTVELVHQGGDPETREYPISFTGAGVRDFNNVLFNLDQIETDNEIRVTFTADSVESGDLRAIKEFTFRKDSYVVDLRVTVENGPNTRKAIGGRQGFGIGWQGGFSQPELGSRSVGYTTGVYALDGKIRTRSIERGITPVEIPGRVDWAGQEKKFFAALLLPSGINPPELVRLSADRRNDDPAYQRLGYPAPLNLEIIHPPVELAVNESTTLEYQLYVGPKNRVALSADAFVLARDTVAPDSLVFHQLPLGMTFIRPLAIALLALMRMLDSTLGMWGLAIIGTTIIVRIVIYPLTHWAIKNQARTMIEQQKIRPEMEEIQKKFKSDPMKRNQAIMQLYRDHNVNPLGFLRGCLPILLQMPIFLALYVVFEQSVELRGQSFMWIPDLSGEDKLFSWGVNVPLFGPFFNLLPILMAVTNFLQMKIMQMPATDEMQARIQKQMMIMLPIMFILFLYRLPSGLILYWIISNIISIGQSYMTKRIIAAHMKEHEEKKANEILNNAAKGKKGFERQNTIET